MDSRQQFEEWAADYHESLGNFYTRAGGMFALDESGEYEVRWLQGDFVAWQASRESILVELPHDVMHVTNIAYGDGRDDVITAIHSAGIRTK
jgi:hypothetical protein